MIVQIFKTFVVFAVEREGQPNMDDDWDSLSVRLRRQRRLRHNGKEENNVSQPRQQMALQMALLVSFHYSPLDGAW